ncbi:MAG: patatin-like phospholipase family protein [Burkholderiaceae bacterium]|nr:patatin-like phospholipase family protein [Burkholderiaceae bacterium]MDP3424261.1 patatin-like phospholipase family protein [Burkholderiaceae bacterium]
MSLDTVITSSLLTPPQATAHRDSTALVLMGGGARTAYQAGVLKALTAMLRHDTPERAPPFPFQLMVGTSAGALNVTYLASQAHNGLDALPKLADFWQTLRSEHVYRLDTPMWARTNKLVAGWALSRQVQRHRALLDSDPLVHTLHNAISVSQLEANLAQGVLAGVAVTASSYSTGVHWTFCQTSPDHPSRPWGRPDRRADMQPITIEHLMASSAIPFLFRAVPLWVNGRKEFFGDGSMRQSSPLSPAIHLGARKVLAIGVGQPQRAGLVRQSEDEPTAGTIAGHAMASVFNDTLQTDVEQAQRVSRTLRSLPSRLTEALPYRPVEVLSIQPSESMDELALRHVGALPASTRDMLVGLGALSTTKGSVGSAAALASYLLFEPPFVRALIGMGEFDAHARRDELLAFFRPGAAC